MTVEGMHLIVTHTAKVITTKCGLEIPTKKAKEHTTIWGDQRVDCMECRPYEWVKTKNDTGYKMYPRESAPEGEVWGQVGVKTADRKVVKRKRTVAPERKVVRRRRVSA